MRNPASCKGSVPTSIFPDERHDDRRHELRDRQYPDESLYEVFGLQKYLQNENRRAGRGLIELVMALVVLFGAVGLLGRERQADHISRSTSIASCAVPSGDGYCSRGIGPDDFGIAA